MQALILVGGEATRLRPLTCNTPKAMVPVLNTPFLEHVIRYLGNHGTKQVVLAQGFLPESMEDYFQDGSRFGAKLVYALETKRMGTAGAVKNAERHLNDTFLVLNGDIFTDLDITAMLQFHRQRRAIATIALTPVEDPTAYGLIETTSEGRVTRFLEKPGWDQITTNMINAGTYILEPEVLKRIPPGTNYSFERQLFPNLLDQGEAVYGYASLSYWIDIGTPEKYLQLHRDILQGEVKGYSPLRGKTANIGQSCNIDPDTQIIGPVIIGNDCTISRGAKIVGPSVIGRGNTIAEDVLIDSSITWQNNRFDQKASIRESILSNDCVIEANSFAEKSVLGDHVIVNRNTRLGPGSRIWPSSV
ncbi:MAG: NDP-sugar synthase [Dehalococcoidales bacterium]|nr:NDP-sugar synthase [Dehalococcoidales bacterium]